MKKFTSILLSLLMFSQSVFADYLTTKRIVSADIIQGTDSKENYIKDSPPKAGVTKGWTCYADAAGRVPVDGTGGSPTGVTFTATSTSPLKGPGAFVLTKTGAANKQGMGCSYNFTIDAQDKGKSLKIFADYIVGSGTFTAGTSGQSGTDSDVIFYIYDVTNAAVIEPDQFKLFSNSSNLSDYFSGNFQATSSTSYRLIAHISTTTTNDFTLKFGNISVSRDMSATGVPNYDWAAYTPTYYGLGTTTVTDSFWKRVGDSIYIKGRFAAGTTTGAAAGIGFPFGLVVDPIKTTIQSLASGLVTNNSSANIYYPLVAPSQAYVAFSVATSTGLSAVTGTGFASAGHPIGYEIGPIPIQGWASNTRQSDGYDSRQIVFTSSGTGSTQALTANVTNISMVTVKDSTTSWTGSTYVVPSSGDYLVSAFLYATIGMTAQVHINGTFYKYFIYSVGNLGGSGHIIVPDLKAGDAISIRSANTVTLAADAAQNINISKMQSPQTISASEIVAVRAKTAATRTTNTTFITIIYDSVDFDTHSAYNSTTGVFTAPVAGIYEACNYMQVVGPVTTINFLTAMYLFKNGSTYAQISGTRANTTAGVQHIANGGTLIQLNAGDTLTFRAYTDTANTLLGNSESNYFTIKRIK